MDILCLQLKILKQLIINKQMVNKLQEHNHLYIKH